MTMGMNEAAWSHVATEREKTVASIILAGVRDVLLHKTDQDLRTSLLGFLEEQEKRYEIERL